MMETTRSERPDVFRSAEREGLYLAGHEHKPPALSLDRQASFNN
jgi:hypothetical protein